nr:hypothetical protein Itr_chr01CG03060 [Ipomoea trifida]
MEHILNPQAVCQVIEGNEAMAAILMNSDELRMYYSMVLSIGLALKSLPSGSRVLAKLAPSYHSHCQAGPLAASSPELAKSTHIFRAWWQIKASFFFVCIVSFDGDTHLHCNFKLQQCLVMWL